MATCSTSALRLLTTTLALLCGPLQAEANSRNRSGTKECQTLASLMTCLLRGYLTQEGLHCKRSEFLSNSHAQAFRLLDMTIEHLQKLPAGEHFVALFGTNQSMLEALLLKRKVMGPSWLALQKPMRVATQSQVQRCSRACHL